MRALLFLTADHQPLPMQLWLSPEAKHSQFGLGASPPATPHWFLACMLA